MALDALEKISAEDTLFAREAALLRVLSLLGAAQKAEEAGKHHYALELCARAREVESPYCAQALARACALTEGAIAPERACALVAQLLSIDAELMLRARAALENADAPRACALLDSCEKREDAWFLLRARADMALGEYASAEVYLHKIEASCEKETAPLLEVCCRERGDFKAAYFYACKQRE